MEDVKKYLHQWFLKEKITEQSYVYKQVGTVRQIRFICELRVPGIDHTAIGNSTSKKSAKTNAAYDFVQYLVRAGRLQASQLPTFTTAEAYINTKTEPVEEATPHPESISLDPATDANEQPKVEANQNDAKAAPQPAEGTNQHPAEGTNQHPAEETNQHPGEGTNQHPAEETNQHPAEETNQHPAAQASQIKAQESPDPVAQAATPASQPPSTQVTPQPAVQASPRPATQFPPRPGPPRPGPRLGPHVLPRPGPHNLPHPAAAMAFGHPAAHGFPHPMYGPGMRRPFLPPRLPVFAPPPVNPPRLPMARVGGPGPMLNYMRPIMVGTRENVEEAEDTDFNADMHGNWTIDLAKNKLHQWFQMNNINADYRYSTSGPPHNRYSSSEAIKSGRLESWHFLLCLKLTFNLL